MFDYRKNIDGTYEKNSEKGRTRQHVMVYFKVLARSYLIERNSKKTRYLSTVST